MDVEWVRRVCLALPHTTESVQWGEHLVFKVGGKMYAVASLEPGRHFLSFKCTPEEFVDLAEMPGIVPAPYSARYHWVALESEDSLAAPELKRLLTKAYDLVFANLPKKTRAALARTGAFTEQALPRRPPNRSSRLRAPRSPGRAGRR